MPFRNIDPIGPAGSINSNVEDMAKYVMMHMAEGQGDIVREEFGADAIAADVDCGAGER